MRSNKGFAEMACGIACAVVVFAGAVMAAPPVTADGAEMAAVGAEMTAPGADMAEAGAARQEAEAAAADVLETDGTEAQEHDGVAAGEAADASNTGNAGQQNGFAAGEASGASGGAGAQDESAAGATATGTAVLLTAGIYTAVRKQWNEKKNEKPKEYVYFENHTKNGTLREEEKQAD